MSAAVIVRLVTAADIASRLGQPLRRVQWILATRPHIRPAARAGVVRVYSTNAVALVQDEIDGIALRRRGVGHARAADPHDAAGPRGAGAEGRYVS